MHAFTRILAGIVGAIAVCAATLSGAAAAETGASKPAAPATNVSPNPTVRVIDGVVQPRRPLPGVIADAIAFFRKSDGGYVPGRIDGPLAGYFTSAHVLEDGSPSSRKFAFPAR